MSPPDCVASASADETRALGSRLGGLLEPGDVIALSGPLGAGKTCFVQGLAEGLGIDPSVPVTSPTFTLAGEYPGRTPLRHADFYRVDGYDRLLDAGFDDMLDGRGVLVVEWPERLPGALPDERLEIRIGPLGESSRRLWIGARGARAGRIREEFLKP